MTTTHITKKGVIYQESGVTVFLQIMRILLSLFFGFRLDCQGPSVVISGDTPYCDNLIKYAKNVDVLIDEMKVAKYEVSPKSALAKRMLSYHSSAEQEAMVFSLTQPKLAVFYVLPCRLSILPFRRRQWKILLPGHERTTLAL